MEKQITTQKPVQKGLMIKSNYDLAQPVQMIQMAKVLKQHIVQQQLFTNIVGKNYAHVEGWQFAGGLMGIYPRVASVENMSNNKEVKWRADVEVVRLKDDKVICRGFAICSNKEGKKRSFDEYAILSMAQTRAIGKAYRNIIGWVMKTAGYEATPSEEMASMGEVIARQTAPVAPKAKVVVEGKVETIKSSECQNCAEIITEAEAKFSQRLFKKSLCRNCQKDAKK